MDQKAIDKAFGKLERARHAVKILSETADVSQANAAWTDFVMACGAIYSTLEKGAKGNPKSNYWYGEKKHARKKDPLLRYLRDARNAEEHGIDFITKVSSKAVVLSSNAAVRFVSDGKNWNAEQISGPPMLYKEPALALRKVFDDRNNTWTEPPMSHLDNEILETSPKAISLIALDYLEAMYLEAQSLVG